MRTPLSSWRPHVVYLNIDSGRMARTPPHIGPVAAVDAQPLLTLERWRVYETNRGDRHFVGYCVETHDGRVTTAILSFNASTKTGVTTSGRRYLLKGWPCFDSDAEHVWSFYTSQNEITETRDVSLEYLSSDP